MSVAVLLLLWIHLAVSGVGGQITSAFIEPVEVFMGVEYYEHEDQRFSICLQAVSWEEARKLCSANNGSLVEFLDAELPAFISRALAESTAVFGAFWIGGKYSKGVNMTEGSWRWMTSDVLIDTELKGVTQFPMENSPFWVDRPNLTETSELCLATDRKLHHLPLIVPVNCDQHRPFICKLPSITNPKKPIIVRPPIDLSEKKFFLFRGEVTWAEALSQCLEYNMKLAKVTKATEFRTIVHRMLRVRPVMENAWISGAYMGNAWKWMASNELINVDKNKSSVEEPFAWYRPDIIMPDGCLLADRHLCDHFVYVEAKCDRRRNFICEQGKLTKNEFKIIKVENSSMYVSTFEVSWFVAQNMCRSCLGGELLQIEPTTDEVATVLTKLYSAMALTLKTEIRHAWIGGYLFNDTFRWASSITDVPPIDKIISASVFDGLHGIGQNGRLTFCDVNFGIDTFLLKHKCLNLDRENQKDFFMYGLDCESKQHFICQTHEEVVMRPTCSNSTGGRMVFIRDRNDSYEEN